MSLGLSIKHLAIDCCYHPASQNLQAASSQLTLSVPADGKSFRDLSNDFLRAEMKRDYVSEAVCFLIIVSVSAWPIVSMVRALSLLK